MADYNAPVRDMQFVLHELLDLPGTLESLPDFSTVDRELVDQVLEEAGKFAAGVVAPLNATGDVEGCTRNDDASVTTPTGFKDAYRQYVEGGWPGLSMAEKYGGQGLPGSVQIAVNEAIYGANAAWGLYIGLTQGAYRCINLCGDDAQRDLYLPKIASGQWTGTMCLTEPQAGSDLGQVKTKAEPNDDGSYSITGTKIFISSGEHDMSENIIHMVLARLPDAPAGTKGISLFVVPRQLPDENGDAGERNTIYCASLEEKMGIHGNATCVMNLEGAKGWLVGEPHKGMPNMFVMMNEARLGVGNEALGLSEGAYQMAASYARERIQSRSAAVPVPEGKSANPIIDHPDVRRMLLTQRAFVQAGRALAYWTALLTDIEFRHPDEAERKRARALVELLTPIAKGYLTDNGNLCTNLAIQCFGGYGYIHETGVEQFFRDVRVKAIYEGTNGIQALDLIGRKVLMDGGERLQLMIGLINDHLDSIADLDDLSGHAETLRAVIKQVEEFTDWVKQASQDNPAESAGAASDYLRLVSHMVAAHLMLRSAEVATRKLAEGQDVGFYEAKRVTVNFYFERLLPEALAMAAAGKAGVDGLMAMPAEAF